MRLLVVALLAWGAMMAVPAFTTATWVVASVAVVALEDSWPVADTQGYGAFWLVCSVALLASVPLTWALRRERGL